MSPKINIIMATYNGENYIENQILSLLQQTYKNWQLIIHDDGSTDKTLEIIRLYMEKDERIKLIEDNIIGLKVGKNFLHALKESTADYVVFADQDDIWLENKLEELITTMLKKEKNQDIPCLVYCDAYVWNLENGIQDVSVAGKVNSNLSDFIMLNGGYQGCSIMINKKLIELTKNYQGIIYHHDDLVSLLAHTFGKVYFIPKKLMLYRQHNLAVTGNKNFKRNIFYKLFNNAGYVISSKHYDAKLAFYNLYKLDMTDDAREIFEEYFRYCNTKSKFQRLSILFRSSLTWEGNKLKILFKTLIQDLFDK